MTLIHRVQTTFTQPICLGFWVGLGSTVKVLHIFFYFSLFVLNVDLDLTNTIVNLFSYSISIGKPFLPAL